MTSALKAEFKKLFTIRSTYGWVLLALIIVGIYAFYGEGFKDSASLIQQLHKKPGIGGLFLSGTITVMANFISLFGGIIALLLITHEYRYNTITYTLTASNSRSKVLFSKITAILGFVLAYSIILTLYGLGMIFLGLFFSHTTLPHQDINYVTYVGKILFHSEGYALAALLFGALIRNQVGSFATLLIIPGAIEGLLSLLLKHNSVYLPFLALDQVTQAPSLTAPTVNEASTGYLSPTKGAIVFLIYLVIGWLIGWFLFLRRDATKLD
ncbi:MAG TPA: ABC transporter permease [Candidatus Saccharimonadales bacterium]|nr:ABC transporter permease [Candidatus Saccharimonadales bacterium]